MHKQPEACIQTTTGVCKIPKITIIMKKRLFKVTYTDKLGVEKAAKVLATTVWEAIFAAKEMDLLFDFAHRTFACQ